MLRTYSPQSNPLESSESIRSVGLAGLFEVIVRAGAPEPDLRAEPSSDDIGRAWSIEPVRGRWLAESRRDGERHERRERQTWNDFTPLSCCFDGFYVSVRIVSRTARQAIVLSVVVKRLVGQPWRFSRYIGEKRVAADTSGPDSVDRERKRRRGARVKGKRSEGRKEGGGYGGVKDREALTCVAGVSDVCGVSPGFARRNTVIVRRCARATALQKDGDSLHGAHSRMF